MHTLQTIAPDLLFILTWVIGIIGILCSATGLYGILMRGWSAQRMARWMVPAILSQAMDNFGWTPLVLSVAVFIGCWIWARHADRIEARQTVA